MKISFVGYYNKIIEIKSNGSINNTLKNHFETSEVYYIKGSRLENYMQFSVNGKLLIVYDIEIKG